MQGEKKAASCYCPETNARAKPTPANAPRDGYFCFLPVEFSSLKYE
jgi:hypothetical protein